MKPQCNLIIDSCCDLPAALVKQPGITMIKFPYVLKGVEYADDLYQTHDAREFYEAMRDKKGDLPTTSQIPTRTLTETFEHALQSGVPTVYLCFDSALSGSFDSAQLMCQTLSEKYPDGKLYCVDTHLASIAEGVLVESAIKQRNDGLTAEEMISWANEARFFVNAQFMVDDLYYLKRGGRIPPAAATLGSALDVKPLLGFDVSGPLSLSGLARGRKKGIRQLAAYYTKRANDKDTGRHIIIGDADCPKDAKRLEEEILKSVPDAVFTETKIGPVIGSHVGPGMLALSFWGPDVRKDVGVADRIARRVKHHG